MAEMDMNVSGMLVNKDGEVIGWCNKGDVVDLQDGDQVVTHHKTAEKMGLLEKFTELKAANKPVKAKAASADGEGVERKARVRRAIPDTGAYTVVKPTLGVSDENEGRAEVFKTLFACSSIEEFLAKAVPYMHKKRDGSEVELAPRAVLMYALDRGAIALS